MSDAYWRYSDSRQHPAVSSLVGKRPRPDYDVPSGRELAGYYTRDDDRVPYRSVRDTESINASYDHYLRNGQLPYDGSDSGRLPGSGMSSHPVDDPRMARGSGRSEVPLPPDASSTLYVECLPANCTRREVAHIFRPFVGYKEVRLVTKESRHHPDPLVLCFVDFVSPPHAATALDALQGYKFDENDRDSSVLRLQFARYPGVRSGGGHRGKR